MYPLKYHSNVVMEITVVVEITVPLKPDTVVHTCNPTTQKTEAGRSEVRGYLWLYSQLEASPGYTKPVSFPKIHSPFTLCLR